MLRHSLHRGFSLLETFVALVLVAIAATGLVVAFVGSTKFGVLARRQANAVALARSVAGQLTRAAYTDTRLANNKPTQIRYPAPKATRNPEVCLGRMDTARSSVSISDRIVGPPGERP